MTEKKTFADLVNWAGDKSVHPLDPPWHYYAGGSFIRAVGMGICPLHDTVTGQPNPKLGLQYRVNLTDTVFDEHGLIETYDVRGYGRTLDEAAAMAWSSMEHEKAARQDLRAALLRNVADEGNE